MPRISFGYACASGNVPPRRSRAIFSESIRSFFAFPPWIAFMYRACPRTNSTPSFRHQSATQYQENMHSAPTTTLSR